ncbi:hypothetical protein [Flagellimonas beolgyonensis]|jgi:hypothetical protein|uniref:hypothetical protein n=1 Tax=Flagellimonas beolgyonensis TaxID=864064 RepID=UPI003257D2ED
MANTANRITPGGFLKMLSFLHLGIAATPIALGIFFYVQSQNAEISFEDEGDMFMAIVPLIAISSIFIGDFLFKKWIGSLPEKMALRDKLAKFQSAAIIKYALMEGAALFAMVIFSNTQNLTYLLIGVFMIFYLILQRPTKDKIERLLNLRGEEKAQFDQLNEPLD